MATCMHECLQHEFDSRGPVRCSAVGPPCGDAVGSPCGDAEVSPWSRAVQHEQDHVRYVTVAPCGAGGGAFEGTGFRGLNRGWVRRAPVRQWAVG